MKIYGAIVVIPILLNRTNGFLSPSSRKVAPFVQSNNKNVLSSKGAKVSQSISTRSTSTTRHEHVISTTTLNSSMANNAANTEKELTKEKICTILELTFIEACLQIATGNVTILKLFIATLKEAYDNRIPIPELVETLESMDQMRNSANRKLTTEEVCLRTLWLNLSYLTLEYLDRIEGGKAELAFDSNIDEALEQTLSVSMQTRGTYKFIVEEKINQFLGIDDKTVMVDSLNLTMEDNTAHAAMMTYSLRIIDKTLKVVKEERMGQGVEKSAMPQKSVPVSMSKAAYNHGAPSMNMDASPSSQKEENASPVDFNLIKKNIQSWNDNGLGAMATTSNDANAHANTNIVNPAQLAATPPHTKKLGNSPVDFDAVKNNIQSWNDNGLGTLAAGNNNANTANPLHSTATTPNVATGANPSSNTQKEDKSPVDFDAVKTNIQSWNDNGLASMASSGSNTNVAQHVPQMDIKNTEPSVGSFQKPETSRLVSPNQPTTVQPSAIQSNSFEAGLNKERLCVILELTFIDSCLEIATGNVSVLKLFIATIKIAYDKRIPIPELVETLESMDTMKNSANRQLTTEESCLRTLWLNLAYLTLEYLDRIEGGKAELAFDSNMDQALEESLSVSILTRGTYKYIVEEKVRQFLGLEVNTNHVGNVNLATEDNTAQAAMMAYSLSIIDKTLKVVREERAAQTYSASNNNVPTPIQPSPVQQSILNQQGHHHMTGSSNIHSTPTNIQPATPQSQSYGSTSNETNMSGRDEPKAAAIDFDLIKKNIQAWNDHGMGMMNQQTPPSTAMNQNANPQNIHKDTHQPLRQVTKSSLPPTTSSQVSQDVSPNAISSTTSTSTTSSTAIDQNWRPYMDRL